MQNLFDFGPLVIAVIPMILGLVQISKEVGLPSKYAPVCALVIGIGLMFLGSNQPWQTNIAQGIIAGLAACGLWAGPKALFASPKLPPEVNNG